MTDTTFAVADLHGRFDLLEAALAAVAAHPRAAHGGRIVFLGDYVDRGPQSADVLARLMAGPPEGWTWTCLKGNHEAMMSICLRNSDRLDWWIENGGDTTIASYRDGGARIGAHLEWVEALPLMHVDAHRVFVHAGVEPAIPLDRQPDKTLLWKRYPRTATDGHGAHHLVHGHDPDEAGPLLLTRRTALDTWAWRTGRLAVAVFDDATPGGPIELVEIRGRAA